MQVEESRRRPNQFARRLFADLPGRYDRLAEILSMGQNRRWRRAMVDQVTTSRPALVLDVATGPAGVALELARRTTARVVGVDLTPAMLRTGVANVAAAHQSGRVHLVVGRAEELPFGDATFDALTFTYLLRYVADPQATLVEMARVLKPGGMMASQEFYVPDRLGWRALWVLYTRLVLPAAGYVTGGQAWYDVGRFLGPSISAHYRRYPTSWHVEAWRRAGVPYAGTRVMSVGGGLVMWGRKEVPQ